jgi:hypothetical protein
VFWSDLQSTSRLKKWTQLLENCVVIILNLISLRPLILVHPFVFLDDVTARHSAGSWTLYREHHLRGQHLLSFFLSLEAELKSVIFYNLNILLFVFFYTLFCSINILYIVYHLFNFFIHVWFFLVVFFFQISNHSFCLSLGQMICELTTHSANLDVRILSGGERRWRKTRIYTRWKRHTSREFASDQLPSHGGSRAFVEYVKKKTIGLWRVKLINLWHVRAEIKERKAWKWINQDREPPLDILRAVMLLSDISSVISDISSSPFLRLSAIARGLLYRTSNSSRLPEIE